MNRWTFLTVLIVVAGVVASLGIAIHGRRSRDSGFDNERARAQTAAEQVATLCKKPCTVNRIERIADGLWRTREVDKGGTAYCATIDLKYFSVASNGRTIHGVGGVPCATFANGK
jgi:hypothetical protein